MKTPKDLMKNNSEELRKSSERKKQKAPFFRSVSEYKLSDTEIKYKKKRTPRRWNAPRMKKPIIGR